MALVNWKRGDVLGGKRRVGSEGVVTCQWVSVWVWVSDTRDVGRWGGGFRNPTHEDR